MLQSMGILIMGLILLKLNLAIWQCVRLAAQVHSFVLAALMELI